MQVAAYGKPIYITENGVPDQDDDVRPRLARHAPGRSRGGPSGTASTCAASTTGRWWTTSSGPRRWSLRFGLFELDPETGERTPRTSAAVYSRIAQANGVPRRSSNSGRRPTWGSISHNAATYLGLETGRASFCPRARLCYDALEKPSGFSSVFGRVAQLAEQRPFKPWVQGSIPCAAHLSQRKAPSLPFLIPQFPHFPTCIHNKILLQ